MRREYATKSVNTKVSTQIVSTTMTHTPTTTCPSRNTHTLYPTHYPPRSMMDTTTCANLHPPTTVSLSTMPATPHLHTPTVTPRSPNLMLTNCVSSGSLST